MSIDAYTGTLGKYHPWIVRKAACLAMYSLPLRGALLQRIDSSENGEANVKHLLSEISTQGRPIYKITEDLYTEMNLHELP